MKTALLGLTSLLSPSPVASVQPVWVSPLRLDLVKESVSSRNLQQQQTPAPAQPPPFIDCWELAELFMIENAEGETECVCEFQADGAVVLTCTEFGCQICDDFGNSCGITSFGLTLSDDPAELFTNLTTSFQYTSGPREDFISFEQWDCDFGETGLCDECEAYLNYRRCNRCEVCDFNDFGFAVDCENVLPGSSFIMCDTGIPVEGVFEAVDYDNDICGGSGPIEENGSCSNATFLSPENPSVIQTFNTIGASEPVPFFCFTERASRGVWFSVVGTGNLLSVSTCSQNTYTDTAVAVYQNGCGSLQCVPSAEQQFGCFNYFPGRAVSWLSEPGVLYHILAGSIYGDTSQFEISLFEVAETSSVCGDLAEYTLEIDGPQVSGSVDELSGPSDDACMRTFRSGAWYRVEPTETLVLRASTCSGVTNFFTGISVMQGSDCDSLRCVAAAGPFDYFPGCGEGGAQVEWAADAGVTYYILIHGDYEERGIFSISISSLHPPENDICESAITLGLGDTIQGSLVNATLAGENMNMATNATHDENHEYSPCYYERGPGVWYAVAGTGDAMRASTCSIQGESVLSVYSGSCPSMLTCVGAGSYNTRCFGSGSSLSWNSAIGETYYILVYGYLGETEYSDFTLSLEQAFPPENDECSAAMGPITPGSDVIPGSTIDAIFDGVFSCYAGSRSGALWYSTIGTGQAFRADTCFDTSGRFDSEMAVYEGSCGSGLQCLASNDDRCGLSSAITWSTVEGVEYFIRVNGLGSQTGDFWLNITAFEPVENDVCATGLPIFPGDTISGTVETATQDFLPYCNRFGFEHEEEELPFSFGAGVWYYVDGEGTALRASTCSPETSFFGTVQVYGGSCDDLSCISTTTREDFSCGFRYSGSLATWFAEAGQRYYILVTDYDGFGGAFGLTLTSFELVGNDICETAFPLADDTVESGTLEGATLIGENNVTAFCTYSSGPGVWYAVTGTGAPMRVTACSFDVDTMLSIFSGSCDSLTCIGTGQRVFTTECIGNYGSSIAWNTVAGELYYLLVESYVDEGTFDLSIQEVFPPNNDECSAAMDVEPGTDVVFGSTVDAIFDGVFSCYIGSNSAGLWYSVQGNGQIIVADTCSSITNFDSEMAVYNGTCSELDCLAWNDDSCGLSSAISWQSVAGVEYLIRVNGLGNQVGEFGLRVRSIAEVENGECSTRLAISPGESILQILSPAIPEESVPFCFGRQGFSGVWYEVVGTGNLLTVSTCSQNTFVETLVSVFEGTCGSLQCVPGAQQQERCNYYPGNSVSWGSVSGVSYKVLVANRYQNSGYYPPEEEEEYYVDDDAFRRDLEEEWPEHEHDHDYQYNYDDWHEDEDQPVFGSFAQIEVKLFEILPSSYNCEDASRLLQVDGPSVSGSLTDNATYAGVEDDACSRAYLSGAWYYVESPVDSVVRASTCSEITDFNTGISVMQGGDCGFLSCVAAVSPFELYIDGCDGGSEVEWAASAGVPYYVLVHGEYRGIGIFSLSLSSLTPPANDVCEGALALGLEGETGTFINSTFVGDNVSETCSYSTGPGVWYVVNGSGNPMRVSTCTFEAGVALSVYNGPCTSLSCISMGSFNPNLGCRGREGSSVSWNTVSGLSYYVLVQRTYGNEAGIFELLLEEIMPPENDDCFSAMSIEPGSELIAGNTQGAIFDGELSCILGASSGGLWYSVNGTGQAMRADTCFDSSGSFGDPEIAVFNGTCGSGLQCIGSNDDFCGLSSAISWVSVEGVEYFIRVKSLGDASVEFWLNLTAFEPVENDQCDTGLPIFPGDTVVGTTLGATQGFPPQCDGFGYRAGAGVWYYVDGADTSLRASTCPVDEGSFFFAFLQVYDGSCDNLFCGSSSPPREDFSCGGEFPGSTVTWFAQAGQRYFLLVSDFGGQGSGNFVLSLTEFEAADNDFCSNALNLTIDGMAVLGSTRDASTDFESCRYSDAPGVWYSLVGNGAAVNVTTCGPDLNFDSAISVMTGPCNGFQECLSIVAYNEQNCFSTFYSSSTATFRAEAGVTYYILVQAADSFFAGEFAVSATSFETAGNDECFQALPIAANGTLIRGTTVGATVDSSLTGCSNFQSPDVWYRIQGTGGTLTASTCNRFTNYDSALSVYVSFDGGLCRDMFCVGYNDDACGTTTSEISWESDAGLTYLLRVHGFSDYNSGNYGLTVTGDEPPPGDGEGDSCRTAVFIPSDGALIRGSTTTASFSGYSDCGFESPDRWYGVRGTGAQMTASLCGGETDFDSYLTVFSSVDGFCDSGFLTCVSSSDDFCGGASEVTWDSSSGLVYYLRVHGFGESIGNYGLRVTSEGEGGSTGGESCSSATDIFADGSFYYGSTIGQTFSGLNNCSPYDSPDLWYRFVGTGSEVTASLCTAETNFDTYLSVYESPRGVCILMNCLANDDDGCGSSTSSQLTWDADFGVTYYLRVHGYNGQSGDFGLRLFGSTNDVCDGAIFLDASRTSFVTGDTSSATYSGARSCAGANPSESNDLWYRVEGTGSNLVATTCNSVTSFDTQISVYRGECRSSLSCVVANDDSCSNFRGTASTVEWFADRFVTYYIRVNGFSSGSGQFELSVGPPGGGSGSNDQCENAILTTINSSNPGSTVGATSDPLLASCGGATAVVGNGVWYTVVGDGSTMIASTCEGTNFDTQISVFSGFGCDSLTCVDGSDQYCGDQSEVEWMSVWGQTYFILVHGYLSAVGDFNLQVISDEFTAAPTLVFTEFNEGEEEETEIDEHFEEFGDIFGPVP